MRARALLLLGWLALSPAVALERREAFDDVVKRAERVVHGDVTRVEAALVTDPSGRHIVTRATFAVRDYLKGTGEPVLVLEFPGGTVGDVTEWVSDAVQPRVGAEWVLVLDDGDRVPARSRAMPVTDAHVGGLGEGMPLERFAARVRAIVGRAAPPLAGPAVKAEPVAAGAAGTRTAPRTATSKTAGIEVITHEGFEGDVFPPPGWSLGLARPTWGPTTYTARAGEKSAWCAGTPPGSSPENGTPEMDDAMLIYGPFDLTGAQDAWVDFFYSFRVENGSMLQTYISTDQQYWDRKWAYSRNDPSWFPGRIGLCDYSGVANYCGQPAVWIRFGFYDGFGHPASPGAFLDEIEVVRDTSPAPNLVPVEFAVSGTTTVEGEPFEIDVRIENRGTGYSAPTQVEIQRHLVDPPWGAETIGRADVPRIEPGESVWVYYKFTTTRSAYQHYTFKPRAWVDPANDVREQNERDNEAVGTTIVTARNLDCPGILTIDPPRASSGTGELVHIRGGGFGEQPKEQWPGVYFAVDSYTGWVHDWLQATPVSWSDSEIVTPVPTGIVDDVPVSAGSAPVYVRAANYQTSYMVPFQVTFTYGGWKWDQWRVPYYIGPNPESVAGASAAITGAARSWSEAGAAFRLDQQPAPTTSEPGAQDNRNVIGFAGLPLYLLARTQCWFFGSTLHECDVTLNREATWTTSGVEEYGTYDVEYLVLYELGAWLHLDVLRGWGWGDDTIGDRQKVMFGWYHLQRTLHEDDAAGIRWIYGRLATLHVAASPAASGITVTPADLDATSSTAVPRDLNYRAGTALTLTAPVTSGTALFDHWSINGGEPVPARETSITLAAGANAATAFYVPTPERCDADSSGRVDGLDLILLSAAFGRSEGEPGYMRAADFDRNGIVDGADLALLAGVFGTSAR